MRLMRDARDELECDFREVYGLDLGRVGEDYSLSHAARLCWGLRPGARALEAVYGEAAGWTRSEALQAASFDLAAAAVWGMGGKRGPKPQPVGPSWHSPSVDMASLSVEDLMGRLGYATGGECNGD